MQERRSDKLHHVVNEQSVLELLKALPGIEKDELGKLVADLRLELNDLQQKLDEDDPIYLILETINADLLRILVQPAILLYPLTQQKVEKENENEEASQ